MKYFNIGLPGTGLESWATVMRRLGFRQGPRKLFRPQTSDQFLSFSEIIYGFPFVAYPEQTLQRCNDDFHDEVKLICSTRNLQDWLKHEQHHRFYPPTTAELANSLEKLFGAVIYSRRKWTDAFHQRISMAKHAAIPLLPLQNASTLLNIIKHHTNWQPPREPSYPHANPTNYPLPYNTDEMVG